MRESGFIALLSVFWLIFQLKNVKCVFFLKKNVDDIKIKHIFAA